MSDAGAGRTLTGWQRAYVLAAAKYVREQALKTPEDEHARSVYAALLEVLEPARRVRRQQREGRGPRAGGSMWDQRSGVERRVAERRTTDGAPPAGGNRRTRDRRSARDRREEKG